MKASKDPTSEYKVGYGKPPKQHQFRKGVSGNPKGRLPKEPPRERMITPRQVHLDFLGVTEQDVKITLNGKEVVLPAIFAIYQRMILKALAGDHRAAKLIMDTRHHYIVERMEGLDAWHRQFVETDIDFQEQIKAARNDPVRQRELEAKRAQWLDLPVNRELYRRLKEPLPKMKFK